MPDPTRRTLFAGLAGLAGAAAVPACRRAAWSPPEHDPTARAQTKPYVPGAETYATYEERTIASSCAQCPAACGIRVRVVEGRAVRIEGNRDNPINRGGIGVRGLSGLQALYDPDRIHGPLRRAGSALVPTSWEDALATLAGALAATRARAPEQLLVMSGGEHGLAHELLARFCRAFGTPNFVDGSPAHGAPLARAMELTLGVRALPAYGWDGAGAILSLEAGLFEDACRSTYFARVAAAMRRERARRARIIHAGPVLDLAAYNADRWLRIQPGTAGALALGVGHVLLRDGTYARELVDGARELAAFRALVAAYPPERVAALAGCEPGDVGTLAGELWDRRPALVIVDERSLAFTNGLDTARAAIALSALLGSIEDPRGGLRIAPAAPLAAWAEVALDDVARAGLASARLDGAAGYPGARAVLDTLPDAIRAAPPAIAVLHQANPVYARACPERWRDALAAVPLVVSCSPFLDETTAAVADLVLPDHTYLERLEDATPTLGAPRAVAGVRRPAVAPVHDTRPTAALVLALAHRLGGAVAAAFPWPTPRDALEERWLGLHAAARGTIVEASPRAFLDRLYAAGFWAEAEDAAPRPFQLALPATWTPPRWDGDPAVFPLVLVPYHPLGHGDGSGANQPWLRHLRPRPGLAAWSCAATMSPHDAPPGIRTGTRVRVVSPYGALVLPVHLDPYQARGSVAIPMGGGHTAYGRYARGFGVNVMELVGPTVSPDTGASPSCTTRVRVEVVA